MGEYWYDIDQFDWDEEEKVFRGDARYIIYPGSIVPFPNQGKQFFVKNKKTEGFRRFRLWKDNKTEWIFESEDKIKCIIKKDMTKETLKKLIEIEFERCETISQFKKEVFRLIDLYAEDMHPQVDPLRINIQPFHFPSSEPDEVPYGEICSCNPKNGGSGICGCVMGNQMVKNPKKYGYPQINQGVTSTDIKGRANCHCGKPINFENPDCATYNLCKDCAMDA